MDDIFDPNAAHRAYDPDRENRTHVIGVRGNEKSGYVVVLTDAKKESEWTIGWDHWNSLSAEERRRQ
ncbi:MAG: hypothetical protein EOP83_09860 [Verrucomicrobiaceae bacterium]|nr:MAG: hypothetical protein EOP83_09860 [Verrucomicrobiaceae bacterium]